MKYLMYRELYLSKSKMASSTIAVAFMTFFAILIDLSFVKGNLSRLSVEVIEAIKPIIDKSMLWLLAIFCGLLPDVVSYTSVTDNIKKWKYFRMSTPVPAQRFALAKTVVYILLTFAGVGLLFLFAWVTSLINKLPFGSSDLSGAMLVFCGTIFIGTSNGIVTLFTSSVEKSVMIGTLCLMAIASVYIVIDKFKLIDLGKVMAFFTHDRIVLICYSLLALSPFILYMFLYFAFRRREK